MKIVENFSLQTGLKINKPDLTESFFPLDHPIEKTIIFYTFAGGIRKEGENYIATHPAFIYDYFNEVLDLLYPILSSMGYKFYQIGSSTDPKLDRVNSLLGLTNSLQAAYLVSKCALFVCGDNIWGHIRSKENKPLIQLFGPTDSRTNSPFWGSENSIHIDSHRFGKLPSYSPNEPFKTINLIPPEQVAQAALNLLKIDSQINIKSVFIGPNYNHQIFELVPNVLIDPSMELGIPIIRMDYEHNLEGLIQNIRTRKCAIILDKEIDLNVLSSLKPNIANLRVCVDNVSDNWLKMLKKIPIPTLFVTEQQDEEKINKRRLELFDICFFDKIQNPTIEGLRNGIESYTNKTVDKNLDLSKLFFSSKRMILSKGKIYLSKAHWEEDISTSSFQERVGSVIDKSSFWNEMQNHWYFIKD